MFCDVIIDPSHPLMNYKLLDDIMLEIAGNLKIQQLQTVLAERWKPYRENLDTLYTDATCYESEMRYPTDQKLLWEGIEKSYETMCELSSRLGVHRPRTKFLDVYWESLLTLLHTVAVAKSCTLTFVHPFANLTLQSQLQPGTAENC